jgi:ribonuclease Z
MKKKRILSVTTTLLLVILVAGTLAYNSHTVQDTLFQNAARAVLSQAPAEPIEGMRVVVCGSASPLGNDPERAQACIAILTPQHLFIFDIGARAPGRIAQARLPLSRIDGVFLTHFHSDHISGIPDVNLASWVQGRTQPLSVYGPTGVTNVVEGFNLAYRLDGRYRTAHHGRALLNPDTHQMTAVEFSPGDIVWQDAHVTVSSFAVEHPPIEPAVGYRVDYGGRSVVISGDTNASDRLFAAAENADLLLHDALSRTLLDPMIETAADLNLSIMSKIMSDVIDYHADTRSLPERARDAGIKQLALYHMVPVPPNALATTLFLRDLPDDIILARDLQQFDLPINSDEIRISSP